MEQTSEELARFLRNFRRVLKEVNDVVESVLDKSYGKENTKELKYKKVEGDKDEDGIYEWEGGQEK
jgi:Sec-independent protein translocase protein TatA